MENKEENLVSVIIPVYNVEKYLPKCLDTVINQTYKNLEIILVDDGSPDNSGKICDEYAGKDSRIKVIHKENGGLSDARNAGIEVAKGKYITFIDSDDYVDDDYVAYLYDMLLTYKTKISIASHRVISENKKKDRYAHCASICVSSKETLKKLLYDDYVDTSAWAKMFELTLFKNIKFPVGRLYEDAATIYKLIDKCENICISTKPIYNYCIRKDSISQNSFSERKLDLIKSTEEMTDYIEKKYPDLKHGCERRRMFSYLSTLSQLATSKQKNKKIEQKLMAYIKINRKEVLKEKKIPKRDRVALYCTIFGYDFYKFAWNMYLKLNK